jgi:hypothetical protein
VVKFIKQNYFYRGRREELLNRYRILVSQDEKVLDVGYTVR